MIERYRFDRDLIVAGTRFGETMTALERPLNDIFAGLPIESYEKFKLMCLVIGREATGPPTQKELAKLLKRSPASLCYILTDMEGKGLVNREEDSSDNRAKRISPTREGKRAYKHTAIEFQTFLEKILGGLEREKLSTFIEVLEHILDRTHTLREDKVFKIPVGPSRQTV